MQNPKHMTTLSLMLEYERLQAKSNPTTEDLTRKQELRREMVKSKGKILCVNS